MLIQDTQNKVEGLEWSRDNIWKLGEERHASLEEAEKEGFRGAAQRETKACQTGLLVLLGSFHTHLPKGANSASPLSTLVG